MATRQNKRKKPILWLRMEQLERHYKKYGTLDNISVGWRTWIYDNRHKIDAIPDLRQRFKKMNYREQGNINDRYLKHILYLRRQHHHFPSLEQIPYNMRIWIGRVMKDSKLHKYAVKLHHAGCREYEADYIRNHKQKNPRPPAINVETPHNTTFEDLVRITTNWIAHNGRPEPHSVIFFQLKQWKEMYFHNRFTEMELHILKRYGVINEKGEYMEFQRSAV